MTEITLVVKQSCETCTLIEPIIRQIAEHFNLRVICQDTQDFPTGLPVEFDASLEQSYRLRIEVVPTLIIQKDGIETSRIFGWDVAAWEALLSIQFKSDLPKFRPGCGSKTHDPGMQERLAAQFSGHMLSARRLNFENVDDIEIGYDQGWSDGLPVVPPTAERVMRMLAGTRRQPDEIIGIVPPDFAPCSIEKIAINAVLAGCRPEYLQVVIAAVEAVLEDQFCMHGLLATTYFSGPMVIVNGPISRAIGMNSGGNALGQGNRANATIGRALQLIIRNVGGGRPGGVDRSALGNPGKYTFAFPKMRPTPAGSHSRWRKGFRLKNQPLRSLRPMGCKAWLTKNLETLSHSVDPLQQGYALLVTQRWFKALMHSSSCRLSMSGYFATRSGTSNKSKTVFWIC